MAINKLSDKQICSLKPKEKTYRVFDGEGLFLEVLPSGGKSWRIKYFFHGQEKRLGLGPYPYLTLKAARARRDELKTILAQGLDPAVADRAKGENTFAALAQKWYAAREPGWAESHKEKIWARFEKDLFPALGARPIKEITVPELLAVVRKIEARGAVDSAHRTLQSCGQVWRFAVAEGVAERDITADLRGALKTVKKKNYPTITDPKEIGNLLRAIEGYPGNEVVRLALRLAPLVFLRPGELRCAEWREIDFESAMWKLPAERMKSRKRHQVPLCRQALGILRELRAVTGQGRYLFPGMRTQTDPISDMTLVNALRRLGYGPEDFCAHSFRSMASTVLHENGFNSDWIEVQLAHQDKNPIKAAYNHALYWEDRKKMMAWWGDYLESLVYVKPILRIA